MCSKAFYKRNNTKLQKHYKVSKAVHSVTQSRQRTEDEALGPNGG